MTAAAAVATPPPWGAHPVALTGEVLRRRIYAPLSYAQVRNAAVVPAVHSEAMALAAWFPLVWRRKPSGAEFVAVRALLDTQRAQPPAARGLLPLVLHGYPFVFDPAGPVTRDAAKMLDDVFADAPSNVGATITSVNHKLTRATVSRFRFLDRFAADLEPTAAISAALDDAGLLAPWQLVFEIAGRQIGIPDLLMIRQDAFETGALATTLHRFGRPAATMISLHRLSLFRAGGLLAMARTTLKDAAADATQPLSAPPLQPVAP
ncbi:MAG: SapC family protein [Xanthobacteraceae bacterium]|nr:SapC family protein [Xanthobacteraceae bacterium]